jgi:hypothetical protein
MEAGANGNFNSRTLAARKSATAIEVARGCAKAGWRHNFGFKEKSPYAKRHKGISH